MGKVYRQTNLENLEQAFSVAERDLGVTRLLDPEGTTIIIRLVCAVVNSIHLFIVQLYNNTINDLTLSFQMLMSHILTRSPS